MLPHILGPINSHLILWVKNFKIEQINRKLKPNIDKKEISEMVDDIRAPAAWRRPKTKIYDYNQDMGCAYYKVLFGQYAQSWNVLCSVAVLLIISMIRIEKFGFSP